MVWTGLMECLRTRLRKRIDVRSSWRFGWVPNVSECDVWESSVSWRDAGGEVGGRDFHWKQSSDYIFALGLCPFTILAPSSFVQVLLQVKDVGSHWWDGDVTFMRSLPLKSSPTLFTEGLTITSTTLSSLNTFVEGSQDGNSWVVFQSTC